MRSIISGLLAISFISIIGCSREGAISTVVVNTPQLTTVSNAGSNGPVIKRLTANPSIVSPGVSTSMSWEAEGADYCTTSGDAGYGWYKPVDAVNLYPTRTSHYGITCVGKTGTATSQVTVTVQ